jgi:periplasmic protein TonB
MQLAPLPEERLLERLPPEGKAAARRFALIVFFCFVAHAISIFLFGRFSGMDIPPPPPEEIPIEIVAEPPPAKEPDPTPPNQQQPAQQPQLDEKEATDAPRASDKKPEKEVRVETPPSEKPKPAPQTAEPEKAVAAKSAEESAQQPKDDHLDGEPLKAADKPRPEPEQTKAEKAAPEPEKPRPEDVLAAALKFAPVGGGNAEATYLSTVYGLVVPHMNLRKVAAGRRHHQGEVVFAIDFGGALIGAKVTKSSGLRDLDAAALAAIRAAAPFPLPPTGSGLNMVFRFNGE